MSTWRRKWQNPYPPNAGDVVYRSLGGGSTAGSVAPSIETWSDQAAIAKMVTSLVPPTETWQALAPSALLIGNTTPAADTWSTLPVTGFMPPLLTVDFSALSAGGMTNAAFVTASGGMTFSRASASTVQTSDQTIDSTPTTDMPCIGCIDGTGTIKGLVVQLITQTFIGSGNSNAPRDLNVQWNTGGATPVTSNAAVSPDGQTKATDCNIPSGGFSPYATENLVNSTMSLWQKAVTVGREAAWNTGSVNTGTAYHDSVTGTWGRIELFNPAALACQVFASVDCRDFSGVGGTTPIARHIEVDFIQLERGLNYSTEAIPLGGANRQADLVGYPTSGSLASGGTRFKFDFQMYMKASSSTSIVKTDTTSELYYYLFSIHGQTDFVRINASTLKLEASIGGTTYTSATALSWNRFDLLEVYFEVGGAQGTVAKWRVNGGAFTDISNAGAVLPNYSHSASAMKFLRDDSDDNFALCWWKSFTAYQ